MLLTESVRVQLAGETDFAGFRAQARALLARGVPPDAVNWCTQADASDLFGNAEGACTPHVAMEAAPAAAVPAWFIALCEEVALHRDPQRFALLYRLLWRFAREPRLRDDPLDADILLARRMAHAVAHDMHKMRAFVRLREVQDEQGAVAHVAWFEPMHHTVEANAPWFMRRFTQMRWAILTPDRCAFWDGEALRFGPGAARDEAPAPDAGEALWLTYYRSIFNPARLKLATMRQHMPRKYWHNLPEAQLITPLAAEAQARSGAMIEQPPTRPVRRIMPLAMHAAVAPAHGTLEALNAALQDCRECPHAAAATQAVPGEGPQRCALMLVGEQPGDQEDVHGRPFVGPAGQLLDRALHQAGLAREALYLTNAVRHFKFELRGQRRIHKTPAQREAAACARWLEEEIALVRPGALVALGATAARSLLGRTVSVTAERGRWLARGDGLRVLVTWHPSALLRMPEHAQAQAFLQFVDDLARASQASA
ncbi:MAG: UdgX family uracil-DNA binding protein [Pseudomonadota bacterium]